MTRENKILTIFVILLAMIVLVLGWKPGIEKEIKPGKADILESVSQPSEITQSEEIIVNIVIESFSQAGIEMKIEADMTILDVLQMINQENPSLNLQTKTYEGLGVLVEGMGEKVNGQDNKYWQYYVNGQMPMVGADEYILENNDKVEWVFAESEF